MKRSVQIYVEGVKIDLFDDEQIQVNSSVQNIQDISKVYSDFSQSFTVPATKTNNKVFQHFYNSDVYGYNPTNITPTSPTQFTFNVNIRKDAQLDINLTPFRTGKIQLEKANLKDGKPESYTLTFYGDITSLKDKFGEDMLSDVDLSSLDHTYTGVEVFNRITDDTTDYDVRYPLISSDRNWQITGGGSNDITTGGGRILFNELFPAVKIKKLFEVIATHYGITFTGTFLNDERFKKCFLWAKNTKSNTFITGAKEVDFASVVYAAGTAPNNSGVDLTTNTITYNYSNVVGSQYYRFVINTTVVPSDASTDYYIDVHRNGVFSHTIQGQGTATHQIVYDQNAPGLDESIVLEMRAANQIDIDTTTNCFWEATVGTTIVPVDEFTITGATQTLTGNSSLGSLVPEIKVADFFSGVLKMFNLTCFGTVADTYEIETLETWYTLGDLYDITKHTDVKTIDVDRVPLYKRISFKYQESKSVLNQQFKALFYREYGNTEQSFTYDGGEFTVQLPFENLMGQKFTGTTTQVAYALDDNLASYVPKPCLMYMYDKQSTDFKFYNGTAQVTVNDYMPFGQDLQVNGITNYTLNFNADRSTFLLTPIADTLYATYYFNYLQNLYDLQNRLIKVKTQLPISMLTNLKLNDRVIIRDKRYVINEMKSNITSGDVDMTLLLDFRPLSPLTIIHSKPTSNCVDVPVNLLNGVCSATISTTTGGVTITPSTITSSQIVEVCVPANSNTQDLIVTEDAANYVNTENFFRIETEESAPQSITLNVTHTYCNGATNDTSIIIQQP
tara:strand:- start:1601 stop:3964 length:2364 start_codon:yes stop_codon:yes gene_type:complete